MMASGSPIITALTEPSGWSTKPSLSTRLSVGWCSTPCPKGFKRIRYYSVQAMKTFAKLKVLIREAIAKVEGVVEGAIKIIARLTYRQRYEQSTGRDPLRCPHCRGEMGVWRIWHPTYGVIYNEGAVIKRGTYASTAQQAGP